MTLRTVVAVSLLLAVSAAGIGGFAYTGAVPDGTEGVRPGNVPYDGRFTFVRISYEMYWGLQTGAFLGDVKWAHDYPRAEQNFGKIVEEISALDIVLAPNGGNVLPLDDPMLTRYPVAYMAEPGFWRPSEADLEALGAYLRKGGFIIFDDFTGDHWYNLVRQLDLAVPGLVPVQLTVDHPIFHSFFEIETLEILADPRMLASIDAGVGDLREGRVVALEDLGDAE